MREAGRSRYGSVTGGVDFDGGRRLVHMCTYVWSTSAELGKAVQYTVRTGAVLPYLTPVEIVQLAVTPD